MRVSRFASFILLSNVNILHVHILFARFYLIDLSSASYVLWCNSSSLTLLHFVGVEERQKTQTELEKVKAEVYKASIALKEKQARKEQLAAECTKVSTSTHTQHLLHKCLRYHEIHVLNTVNAFVLCLYHMLFF